MSFAADLYDRVRNTALQPWSRQMEHLPLSIALEEADTPGFKRALVAAVGGLVLLAIVWAAIARVDEVAASPGVVVPGARTHAVQHLEGGIVAAILAKDGESVRESQVLLRLDPAAARSELARTRTREAALALQAERLKAFASNAAAQFSGGKGYDALAADQRELLAGQIEAHRAQRRVLAAQLEQAEAESGALASRSAALERQVAAAREERDTRKALFEKGLGTRILMLDSERRLADLEGSQGEAASRKRKLAEAVAETRGKLAELDARLRHDALNEYSRVAGELAETRDMLERLEDRVTRLDVRAPVAGVVKGLTVRTIGAVVPPGGTLLELVPVDGAMAVEAKLDPRHAGHLAVGQKASVKITAYDFARYGVLRGTVEEISATTFETKEGGSFYKVVVRLDEERLPLWAGMTAQVDVTTGDRSILAYLLKPIARTFGSGFRER